MALVDIFKQDAFSMISLTDTINKVPFKPGQIGELGLYQPRGIRTNTVALEELDRAFGLIQSSPKCSPAANHVPTKRNLRSLSTVRIACSDYIPACELAGVRAEGSESDLQTVQTILQQRMEMAAMSLDLTIENLRLGALKGEVLDADGSSIVNYFTEFGVTQQTVPLALGTLSGGALKTALNGAMRLSMDVLGGLPSNSFVALMGKDFADALGGNAEVREAHQRIQDGRFLVDGGCIFGSFEFACINWVEYRGTVNGEVAIADDEAYLIPMGVPNQFLQYHSPADFLSTTNSVGLPRYSRTWVDPRDRFVELESLTCVLPVNTRPNAVIQLTSV